MADKIVSDLDALSSPATGDLVHVVDVSDTTDSAGGTSKKSTLQVLADWLAALTQTLTNKTLTSPRINTPHVNEAVALTTTATELNYVSGVTSAIQTQINTKAPIADPEFTGDVGLATGGNIQVNAADPYRTISLTPGFLKPTTTAGCADSAKVEAGTNDIDYDVLDFDKDTDEHAYCNFHMPDSYDGGTILFRYIWTCAAGIGGTGKTVNFVVKGLSLANDDAIDTAQGTGVAVADTWIADGDIHISAWSTAVTLANTPAAGDLVHLDLMRDVSEDDLAGDARIIQLQIKYQQAQYSD